MKVAPRVRARLSTWLRLTPARARAIRSLPESSTNKDLQRRPFLVYQGRIGHQRLEVFHTPFDYLNRNAAIIIVGITPAWTQMNIAYRHARVALRAGFPARVVCWLAKREASFGGPIRENLVRMLDRIGLPRALGLRASTELFGERADLLHSTSVISCPVFVGGALYTGHHPRILKTDLFREFAARVLASELRRLPNALIIPCGDAVTEVLEFLIDHGQVNRERCLLHFPPSIGSKRTPAQAPS